MIIKTILILTAIEMGAIILGLILWGIIDLVFFIIDKITND